MSPKKTIALAFITSFISISLLTLGFIYGTGLILISAAGGGGDGLYVQHEDLESYEEDFNAIVALLFRNKDTVLSSKYKYLRVYVEDDIYGFSHIQDDESIKYLEVDKQEKDSLNNIIDVFGSFESLDRILFDKDGFAFFYSSEMYDLALVYSIKDSKPKFACVDGYKYSIIKIKNHWYQISRGIGR